MRSLRALLGAFPFRSWLGPRDAWVTGVADHSAQVLPGHVFVCVQGTRTDGHLFAAEAVARGAEALVVERPLEMPAGVVQVVVEQARHCLAHLAVQWYDRASSSLTLVAVTGTNGKTTTTYLIDAIARQAGRRTGLVGTVKVAYAGRERPAEQTTPRALALQGGLADMLRAGVDWATVEVSSHALAQARVEGCQIDAAVFTNLSRDHFDLHQDFEQYFETKRRLFTLLAESAKPRRSAVVNADDAYGGRLVAGLRNVEVVGFGLAPGARVRARDLWLEPGGSRFRLVADGQESSVRLPLPGRFNVYNALAAAAAAWACGLPLEAIRLGLEAAPGVPGRWQTVSAGGLQVVVDFAHNPGGLSAALALARQVTRGRLIVVFGAPGFGDRQKRPLMGAEAARYADYSILTQDSSDGEDPAAVAQEVTAGLLAAGGPMAAYEIELDRPRAIARAIELARPGDLVLICGRGHETHLVVGERRIPMRDDEIARRCLERMGEVAGGRVQLLPDPRSGE